MDILAVQRVDDVYLKEQSWMQCCKLTGIRSRETSRKKKRFMHLVAGCLARFLDGDHWRGRLGIEEDNNRLVLRMWGTFV